MTNKITREELQKLFGENMPVEVVAFLFSTESAVLPVEAVRERLKQMALTHHDAYEKALDAAQSPMSCSFCGRTQHEVKKLIAGPSVMICDQCVVMAMDTINKESMRYEMQETRGKTTLCFEMSCPHCSEMIPLQAEMNAAQPSITTYVFKGEPILDVGTTDDYKGADHD